MTVPAASNWPSNAHLIEDVAALGYLHKDWFTLDPTYGEGVFWRRWQPDNLTRTDLIPEKSPDNWRGVDFTDLPWEDEVWDAVVFDPPYKLNGTPSATDHRYGVNVVRTWQERHQLIRDGIVECARVLKPGGIFLLKCQDQVCSGKVRWQTFEFATYAGFHGLDLIDRFDLLGTSRPQPAGRRQVHAHGRPSTLLVFRREAIA